MNSVYSKIEQIIEHFNFEKVHHYMSLVKWSWCDGKGPDRVPTIDQLKECARQLLLETYNEKLGRQTGGFVTEYYSGNSEYLHLHFSIESFYESF